MAGKFERKLMSDIDLEDPFFDSLKSDYPGSATSTGFEEWFHKKAKAKETALVFEDENGVGAFIKLKPGDNEEIRLQDGTTLPQVVRLKISTIKISERYRNRRIGEGAIGLTLWEWRDTGINEIYVTVFEKHGTLTSLLEKFGFSHVGYNLDGERVYIKNRNRLDFSDPCKAFPFLSNNIEHAGCLVIDMDYHDTMFAYSELANTLQKQVDLSVANGLKKVYLGSPYSNLGFGVGDPVFIYRRHTGASQRGYKSCITSYCIATRIETVKQGGRALMTYGKFRDMVGNKSVFTEQQLQGMYTYDYLTLIELLYYGYFGAGNNVNWFWLKNNGCWGEGHPMSSQFTRYQVDKILREGNVDVENVIVDETQIRGYDCSRG